MDKALEELRREPMPERGRDMGRRKDLGSPPAGRKKKAEKKSVVEIMQQRAESRARSDKEEEEKKKRKRKKKDKARKKRKSLEDSSSSSSGSSNSSSQPDFRSSSARGGELWRLAQKKPGRLSQLSLDEMTRYLAGRSELGNSESHWRGEKVLAYLN